MPCLGPLNPLSWTPYSPPPRTRSLAPQCRPSGTLEFHPTPPLPPGPVCSISCSSRKGALLSLASLPEPFVCWVCRKLYGRWPRAHLPQGPEGGGSELTRLNPRELTAGVGRVGHQELAFRALTWSAAPLSGRIGCPCPCRADWVCVRDIFKTEGWIETPKSPNKTRETTRGEKNPDTESPQPRPIRLGSRGFQSVERLEADLTKQLLRSSLFPPTFKKLWGGLARIRPLRAFPGRYRRIGGRVDALAAQRSLVG